MALYVSVGVCTICAHAECTRALIILPSNILLPQRKTTAKSFGLFLFSRAFSIFICVRRARPCIYLLTCVYLDRCYKTNRQSFSIYTSLSWARTLPSFSLSEYSLPLACLFACARIHAFVYWWARVR